VSTYLATERLTLRPLTAEQADLLIELDSDPAVMRFLSGGEPTAPELVRERDMPSILAGYDRWDGRFGLFAAFEQDTDEFVGWFSLRPERSGPTDEAELGYRLRQDAWGKGYATEVSRALLHKAFAELDVRVVWGETMALNLPSQKVMEKLGMTVTEQLETPEDMLMVEGSEQGGFRYEITREQWAQR
jgi:RimJ/RimL family protein N-acetyltransferase